MFEKDLLKGRMTAITGGGKGLGRAIAEVFASVGSDLILLGRGIKALEKAASELKSKFDGGEVIPVTADITDPQSVRDAAGEISKKVNRIDILINNAGGFSMGTIEEFSDGEWDKIIKLNLYGQFYMTKYFLPLVRKSSAGHIFYINSIGGKVGLKKAGGYAASKSGLRGMAESLSEELRKDGIRITSVYPHMMNSAGNDIPEDKRNKMIETSDVARQIVAAASSPPYVDIPEIIIYPKASGIVKRDNLS